MLCNIGRSNSVSYLNFGNDIAANMFTHGISNSLLHRITTLCKFIPRRSLIWITQMQMKIAVFLWNSIDYCVQKLECYPTLIHRDRVQLQRSKLVGESSAGLTYAATGAWACTFHIKDTTCNRHATQLPSDSTLRSQDASRMTPQAAPLLPVSTSDPQTHSSYHTSSHLRYANEVTTCKVRGH